MPKIVDHDQYRNELLVKCFDLFAERGVESLSMRQIADALGVSTGTLYHYFASKAELFDQLAENLPGLHMDSVIALIPAEASLGERVTLLMMFVSQSEDLLRKQLMIMMDYLHNHREDTSRVQSVALRYRALIKSILDTEDEIFISGVIAQVLGLVLVRLLEGDSTPFDPHATLQTLTRLLNPN